MCVVEQDVWCYPVGDGQELRGDDMPNPFRTVERFPWDDWEVPWDRGLRDEESFDRRSEQERIACWLHDVGTMLWEIQLGRAAPYQIATIVPESSWLHWAISWVELAEVVHPPPRRKPRRLAAFRRREAGVVCLLSSLLGLYTGLQGIIQRAEADGILAEPDEPVMWS